MRPFLHIISIGLSLPSIVFALASVILGHAISGASIWQFFDRLINDALWIMTWGIYVAAVLFIVIIAGGFFVQTRWIAASFVAVLSAASVLVLIFFDSSHLSLEQWLSLGQWQILVPSFLSLSISSWLAYVECP